MNKSFPPPSLPLFHGSSYVPLFTRACTFTGDILCSDILEVPTDFFKHLWIQGAVSLMKPPHDGFRIETAVTKPFRKRSGYKFITAILYVTAIP
jgi:hypothetical protein